MTLLRCPFVLCPRPVQSPRRLTNPYARRAIAAFHIAALLLVASDLQAAPIKITVTDPAADYFDSRATCRSSKTGTKYVDCIATGFLDSTPRSGEYPFFRKSFRAWNATNAAGSKWKLTNGGELPGGELEVTKFDTFALSRVGGVEISVSWTYAGADKGDFKWSQALYDNYLIDGSIVAPFFEMDVKTPCDNTSLSKQCPPLYPFQYADRHFYDKPRGPWPNAFFDAAAFLSKADYTTRRLTIYEGIYYGFRLDADPAPAPEPVVLMLLLVAAGCATSRWRHRARPYLNVVAAFVAPVFRRTSQGLP
jgi:hypothetical protein